MKTNRIQQTNCNKSDIGINAILNITYFQCKFYIIYDSYTKLPILHKKTSIVGLSYLVRFESIYYQNLDS